MFSSEKTPFGLDFGFSDGVSDIFSLEWAIAIWVGVEGGDKKFLDGQRLMTRVNDTWCAARVGKKNYGN